MARERRRNSVGETSGKRQRQQWAATKRGKREGSNFQGRDLGIRHRQFKNSHGRGFGLSLNVNPSIDLSIRDPNKIRSKYQNSPTLPDYGGNDVSEAPIPVGETLPLNLPLIFTVDRFVSNSLAFGDMVSGTSYKIKTVWFVCQQLCKEIKQHKAPIKLEEIYFSLQQYYCTNTEEEIPTTESQKRLIQDYKMISLLVFTVKKYANTDAEFLQFQSANKYQLKYLPSNEINKRRGDVDHVVKNQAANQHLYRGRKIHVAHMQV